MTNKYIPKHGDIVWIDFDLSAGQEIQKRRPALVISKYNFNKATMFAVVCPITSTIKQSAIRYTLPKDLEISGQILIPQLKSLDFTKRNIQFIEKLPVADLTKVNQIVNYIF